MKKIIFFMTVFACAFSLVSCGKKKTQKKASGERELSTVEKKYEGKIKEFEELDKKVKKAMINIEPGTWPLYFMFKGKGAVDFIAFEIV